MYTNPSLFFRIAHHDKEFTVTNYNILLQKSNALQTFVLGLCGFAGKTILFSYSTRPWTLLTRKKGKGRFNIQIVLFPKPMLSYLYSTLFKIWPENPGKYSRMRELKVLQS
jgi:hypothetical protein